MARRIVIMTVPFGGGHHATARTLAELLRRYDSSLEVDIIDVITEAWPSFSRRTTETYIKSTARPGGFWFRVYYYLTDKFPYPLRWFASVAFRRYARQRMIEMKPDLIIATFPFLGHVAARARDFHGLDMPVLTVITDAGNVQGIWLCGHEDVILTATEDTVEYATRRKLGKAEVKHIGFPVSEKFHRAIDRTEARRDLGLTNKFTVLITAGGLGMSAGRAGALAKRLTKLDRPIQLLFVAGKNERLLRELKKLKFPANVTGQFYGFTDQMYELMSASDLVCTKAGWLTISEALMLERPLLIFDAIPGHEEQNAKYVVDGGYGVYLREPEKAVDFISNAAQNAKFLVPYETALSQQPQGSRSVDELASYLLSLVK